MRYAEFQQLAGPEQSRHWESLDWEQRYLLTFEALLAMERKHDDLRTQVTVLLGDLVDARRGWQAGTDGSGPSLAEAVLKRDTEIRELRDGGMSMPKIGARFQISKQRVREILSAPPKLHKVRLRWAKVDA